MTNLALWLPALLCVLSSVTTACAWSDARPTFLVQLSRVDRAKRTLEGVQQAREFVVSASVSLSLDASELEASSLLPADAVPNERLDSAAVAPFDLTPADPVEPTFATPFDPATTDSGLAANVVPILAIADPSEPALPASETDAAFGCERSPILCSWAAAAEDTALFAILERHGAEL